MTMYQNQSKQVMKLKVTILWNQEVQTDRTIGNNKPGITICDNKQGTCMSIDVAVPRNRNVIKTEGKRISKYEY